MDPYQRRPGADGDVDESVSPRPTEGVGDDDGDVDAAQPTQSGANARC